MFFKVPDGTTKFAVDNRNFDAFDHKVEERKAGKVTTAVVTMVDVPDFLVGTMKKMGFQPCSPVDYEKPAEAKAAEEAKTAAVRWPTLADLTVSPPAEEGAEQEADDLDAMKFDELGKITDEMGLDTANLKSKEDRRAAIRAKVFEKPQADERAE